jgi:hypothetical protein
MVKLSCCNEAAHEKRTKDTDNFLVTVGDEPSKTPEIEN